MAKTETLIATIMPDDATDKTLTWSSSDENIATVDNDGTVSAVSAGTAIITAKTINELTDTCEVYIEEPKVFDYVNTYNSATISQMANLSNDNYIVTNGEETYSRAESIKIDTPFTLSANDKWQIETKVKVKGDIEEYRAVILGGDSEDESTVSYLMLQPFTANGNLTTAYTNASVIQIPDININTGITYPLVIQSRGDGNLYIKVESNGEFFSVEIPVSEERPNREVVTAAYLGNSFVNDTNYLQTNAEIQNLYLTVLVVEPESVEITGDKDKIYEDEELQLTVQVLPVSADDKAVTWTSSDDSIATVSSTGLVTGISEGSCTITATTSNNLTDTYDIEVEILQFDYVDNVFNTTLINHMDRLDNNGSLVFSNPTGAIMSPSDLPTFSEPLYFYSNQAWKIEYEIEFDEDYDVELGAYNYINILGNVITDINQAYYISNTSFNSSSKMWIRPMTIRSYDKSYFSEPMDVLRSLNGKYKFMLVCNGQNQIRYYLDDIKMAEEIVDPDSLILSASFLGDMSRDSWEHKYDYKLNYFHINNHEEFIFNNTLNDSRITNIDLYENSENNIDMTTEPMPEIADMMMFEEPFVLTAYDYWRVETEFMIKDVSKSCSYIIFGGNENDYRIYVGIGKNGAHVLFYYGERTTENSISILLPNTLVVENKNKLIIESRGDGKVYAKVDDYEWLSADIPTNTDRPNKEVVPAMYFGNWIYTYNDITYSNGSNVIVYSLSLSLPTQPESISLDKDTIEFTGVGTEILTATLLPEDTVMNNITWTSSNELIATVDENGMVTAIGGAGNCTITATTSNNLTATCEVTMIPPAFNYIDTLKNSTLSTPYQSPEGYIKVGDFSTMDTAAKINNGAGITLSLTDDFQFETVVDVDYDALVQETYGYSLTLYPFANESATGTYATTIDYWYIRIYYTHKHSSTDSLRITFARNGTYKIISIRDDENLFIDVQQPISIVFQDIITEKRYRIKINDVWYETSYSDNAAMYSGKNGKVMYVGNGCWQGDIDISEPARYRYFKLSKPDVDAESITLDKSSITFTELDATETLTATILPEDTTDKTVTWTSSDETIATVDEDGLVTSVDYGTCVITVTTHNGLTATCDVEAKEPIQFDYVDEINNTYVVAQPTLQEDGSIRINNGNMPMNTKTVLNSATTLSHTAPWEFTIEYKLDEGCIPEKTHNIYWFLGSNDGGANDLRLIYYMDTPRADGGASSFGLLPLSYPTLYQFSDSANPLSIYDRQEFSIKYIADGGYYIKHIHTNGKYIRMDDNPTSSISKSIMVAKYIGTIYATSGSQNQTINGNIYKYHIKELRDYIYFNKHEMETLIGRTEQIKPKILTTNSALDEADIAWTSSNDAIATVDNDGNVTGVAIGECVITATLGDLTQECNISVVEKSNFDYSDTLFNSFLAFDAGTVDENGVMTQTTVPANASMISTTIPRLNENIKLYMRVEDEWEIEIGFDEAPNHGTSFSYAIMGFDYEASKLVDNDKPYLPSQRQLLIDTSSKAIRFVLNSYAEATNIFNTTFGNKTLVITKQKDSSLLIFKSPDKTSTVAINTNGLKSATNLHYFLFAYINTHASYTDTQSYYPANTKIKINKFHIRKPVINVTSISLDKTEIEMLIDDTEQLTATVLPEDATDKTVTWSSSDVGIATVDSDGIVTGIEAGSCTITATTSNNLTATSSVTVKEPIPFDYIDEINGMDYTNLAQTPNVNASGILYMREDNVYDISTTTYLDTPFALYFNMDWEIDIDFSASGYLENGTTYIPIVHNGLRTSSGEYMEFRIFHNKTSPEYNSISIYVCSKLSDGTKSGKSCTYPINVPLESDRVYNFKLINYKDISNYMYISFEGSEITRSTSTALTDKVSNTIQYIGLAGSTFNRSVDIEEVRIHKLHIKPVPVDAQSISIDKVGFGISKGQTQQLTATILPENTTDKTVTWTSTDDTIATVDSTGLVTGVESGFCNIIATTHNGLTASCNATILVDAESITLDKESLVITGDYTETLTATILPENTSQKSISWVSSNEAYVTVDRGVVTPVGGRGFADITATTHNGITTTCEVEMAPPQFDYVDTFQGTNLVTYYQSPAGYIKSGIGSVASSMAVINAGDPIYLDVTDDIQFETDIIFDIKGQTQDSTYILMFTPWGNIVGNDIPDPKDSYVVNFVMSHNAKSDDMIYITYGKNNASTSVMESSASVNIDATKPINLLFQDLITQRKFKYRVDGVWYEKDYSDIPGLYSANSNILYIGNALNKNGTASITTGPNQYYKYFHISEAEVFPDSISVTPETYDLPINKTLQINYEILPENTTNKSVTFESTDTDICTVSENGLVTPVAQGEATINITSVADGFKTAACVITVVDAEYDPESITLNKDSIDSLFIGGTETLTATILPENATDKTVMWTSSDDEIATVDGGVVTGIEIGTCTITATTINGLTAMCDVTVKPISELLYYDGLKNTYLLNNNMIDSETGYLEVPENTSTSEIPATDFNSLNEKLLLTASDTFQIEMELVLHESKSAIHYLHGANVGEYSNTAGVNYYSYLRIDRTVGLIFRSGISMNIYPMEFEYETPYKIIIKCIGDDHILTSINDSEYLDTTLTYGANNTYKNLLNGSLFGGGVNSSNYTLTSGATTIKHFHIKPILFDYKDEIKETLLGVTPNVGDNGVMHISSDVTPETISMLSTPLMLNEESFELKYKVSNIVDPTKNVIAFGAQRTSDFSNFSVVIFRASTKLIRIVAEGNVYADVTYSKDISSYSEYVIKVRYINETNKYYFDINNLGYEEATFSSIQANKFYFTMFGRLEQDGSATNMFDFDLEYLHVKALIEPESISLSSDNVTLDVDSTVQIEAEVLPGDAADVVSWISSDDQIATVSSTGLITGISEGNCVITATAYNGLSATCDVEVLEPIPFDYIDEIGGTRLVSAGTLDADTGVIYFTSGMEYEFAPLLDKPLVLGNESYRILFKLSGVIDENASLNILGNKINTTDIPSYSKASFNLRYNSGTNTSRFSLNNTSNTSLDIDTTTALSTSEHEFEVELIHKAGAGSNGTGEMTLIVNGQSTVINLGASQQAWPLKFTCFGQFKPTGIGYDSQDFDLEYLYIKRLEE